MQEAGRPEIPHLEKPQQQRTWTKDTVTGAARQQAGVRGGGIGSPPVCPPEHERTEKKQKAERTWQGPPTWSEPRGTDVPARPPDAPTCTHGLPRGREHGGPGPSEPPDPGEGRRARALLRAIGAVGTRGRPRQPPDRTQPRGGPAPAPDGRAGAAQAHVPLCGSALQRPLAKGHGSDSSPTQSGKKARGVCARSQGGRKRPRGETGGRGGTRAEAREAPAPGLPLPLRLSSPQSRSRAAREHRTLQPTDPGPTAPFLQKPALRKQPHSHRELWE